MSESLIQWIDFPILGDERGSLIALEADRVVPFPIKRVYYIFNTADGVSRGFHAHRDLKQLAVCVKGSCTMMVNNGYSSESAVLDTPTRGLLIENLIWREMHNFSADCVLLVLASKPYDEADYIRNYDDFIEETRRAARRS